MPHEIVAITKILNIFGHTSNMIIFYYSIMKQITIILFSLLLLRPVASAQGGDASAPICPGALESSVIMEATGDSFTVRTEGIPTRYNVFPTYQQTILATDQTVLLSYEATKLNEGAELSCAEEMRQEHDTIVKEIANAAPVGSSAEKYLGPELADIIACLKSDRHNCETRNAHQLDIAYGVTDEDAKTLLSVIAEGAFELTLAEGGTTSTTYYYSPKTGALLPVLSGGC